MSAVAFDTRVSTTASTSDPESWLDRYGDYLFRHALFRLRDRTLAEDVVQETLLAAVASRDRFLGLSNEKTWLVGILKHKILDYFRRSQSLLSLDTDDEDFFDSEGHWKLQRRPNTWPDPVQALENKEFQRVINDCLDELPERLRRVFILREVEGLSSEEICALLDVSSSNLAVMLHRARVRLQGLLMCKW